VLGADEFLEHSEALVHLALQDGRGVVQGAVHRDHELIDRGSDLPDRFLVLALWRWCGFGCPRCFLVFHEPSVWPRRVRRMTPTSAWPADIGVVHMPGLTAIM